MAPVTRFASAIGLLVVLGAGVPAADVTLAAWGNEHVLISVPPGETMSLAELVDAAVERGGARLAIAQDAREELVGTTAFVAGYWRIRWTALGELAESLAVAEGFAVRPADGGGCALGARAGAERDPRRALAIVRTRHVVATDCDELPWLEPLRAHGSGSTDGRSIALIGPSRRLATAVRALSLLDEVVRPGVLGPVFRASPPQVPWVPLAVRDGARRGPGEWRLPEVLGRWVARSPRLLFRERGPDTWLDEARLRIDADDPARVVRLALAAADVRSVSLRVGGVPLTFLSPARTPRGGIHSRPVLVDRAALSRYRDPGNVAVAVEVPLSAAARRASEDAVARVGRRVRWAGLPSSEGDVTVVGFGADVHPAVELIEELDRRLADGEELALAYLPLEPHDAAPVRRGLLARLDEERLTASIRALPRAVALLVLGPPDALDFARRWLAAHGLARE